MSTEEILAERTEYKYGFVTPIESDVFPKGLTEETVRAISAKKGEPEFMLRFRLKAFAKWREMEEPAWPNVQIPKIDYQKISYYRRQSPSPSSKVWMRSTLRS